MATPIIVCGASGRMGTQILQLGMADKAFEIAGALESPSHPSAGKTILDGKVKVSSQLDLLKRPGAVLIDFTAPEATLGHLNEISGWNGSAAVVGTTGFSKLQSSEIAKLAKKMPIVLSPNMSRGVNLIFQVARILAKKLSGYDIEIIETHHNQKKDAPSGTALGLAREIADEIKRSEDDFVYGRKGEVGARKPREIGIHAVRAADIVGEHTVIFAAPGERVELTHRATSREAFASGALHAALWAHGKPAGLYSMKDVMSDLAK